MSERRDCSRFRPMLALLPGGDLPHDEAQAVREHLTNCRGCQRLLGDQLRSRAIVRELSPERVHPRRLLETVTASGVAGSGRRGFESGEFFDDLKRDIMASVNERPLPVPRSTTRLAQAMTVAALLLLALYLVPFGVGERHVEAPLPLMDPMAAAEFSMPGPAGAASVGLPLTSPGLMGREEALRYTNLELDGLGLLGGGAESRLVRKKAPRRTGSRKAGGR